MTHLLQRARRMLARSRMTERLSVWTRNWRGQSFHYDIRICPARSCRGHRSMFLVRFDRTGPQGNTERVYRRMNHSQVRQLRHESA